MTAHAFIAVLASSARRAIPRVGWVLLLFACGQVITWPAVKQRIRQDFPTVPQMSTAELASRLESAEARPVLLDVREAKEYAVSHLPGAVRVAPDAGPEALPPGVDKDTPIVAYCSVGYRSSSLTQRLMAAGFSDVANLEGSIFAWANEGRTVVREGVVVRQVHPYNRLWGQLLDASLHAHAPPP